MGSLSRRGRLAVVLGFVLSAGLCATAAVALVSVSNGSPKDTAALPQVHPLLSSPSGSPTPATTIAASVAPAASASPTPTPAPTRSAMATSRPSPRVTQGTGAVPDGLRAEASIGNAGGATTADVIQLVARATDGSSSIRLDSLDWGDGAVVAGGRGTPCTPPAAPPTDCRTYSFGHRYAAAGTYQVTLRLTAGMESAVLTLSVQVADAPSASPTAAAAQGS